MHDEAAFNAIPEGDRLSARGIEVGHIFYFGTKYSEPMGAKVQGPDGKEHAVHMGSYGIGPTRLVPAIIEASHDENGIIWPDIGRALRCRRDQYEGGRSGLRRGRRADLCRADARPAMDVLYDDTDDRAGAKFATADLIGVPVQIIVGPRAVANGEVEVKDRKTGARETMTIEAAINRFVA